MKYLILLKEYSTNYMIQPPALEVDHGRFEVYAQKIQQTSPPDEEGKGEEPQMDLFGSFEILKLMYG